MWDDLSGTLLYVDTSDDQERNAEEIVLRMSLLSQFVLHVLQCVDNSHHYILDILERNCHVASKIHMSISVDGLFWMRYMRSNISIPSGRNFCHGSAKSSINAQEGKNMPEVSFYPLILLSQLFLNSCFA